jgi:hypothetical protein
VRQARALLKTEVTRESEAAGLSAKCSSIGPCMMAAVKVCGPRSGGFATQSEGHGDSPLGQVRRQSFVV